MNQLCTNTLSKANMIFLIIMQCTFQKSKATIVANFFSEFLKMKFLHMFAFSSQPFIYYIIYCIYSRMLRITTLKPFLSLVVLYFLFVPIFFQEKQLHNQFEKNCMQINMLYGVCSNIHTHIHAYIFTSYIHTYKYANV